MCILSRSQLDEREANEKFLEAMLLIADVRDVKEEEDIRALRSWLSSQNKNLHFIIIISD